MKPAHSVDYRCDKCKVSGVKLWRNVHGAKNSAGHALLCASCLAPNATVTAYGKEISEYGPTDQVNGWLPAVPTGDTFWGYASVPPADAAWWRALPVEPHMTYGSEVAHLREVLENEQRLNVQLSERLLEMLTRSSHSPSDAEKK